jgi:hypothetical protein
VCPHHCLVIVCCALISHLCRAIPFIIDPFFLLLWSSCLQRPPSYPHIHQAHHCPHYNHCLPPPSTAFCLIVALSSAIRPLWYVIHHQSSVVRCPFPLSVVCCPSSVVHCLLSLVHCPSSVIRCSVIPPLWSVIHHPSSIICHPLSIIHCPSSVVPLPSSVAHHPSSIVHCLLSVVHCPSSVIGCPSSIVSPLNHLRLHLSVRLSHGATIHHPLVKVERRRDEGGRGASIRIKNRVEI